MPRDAFRFEDTNRNMSPEMRPEEFRDFQEIGPRTEFFIVWKKRGVTQDKWLLTSLEIKEQREQMLEGFDSEG